MKEPQQLVLLTMRGMHYGNNSGGNAISYPMYPDFRDNNHVFNGMFCRFPNYASLSFGGQTERVASELVSGSYFPVLGVSAALGQVITPDDDSVPGGHPVVMLSYPYWKARFAANREIVGKTIVVNGHNMTVIGVAQQGFDGVELGYAAQIFVPVMGVTAQQAKAAPQPYFHSMIEMEVREPAFRTASAQTRAEFLKNIIDVLPGSQGRSYVRRQLQTPLWLLMGSADEPVC